VERFYDGSDDPSENIPMDISILDDCGRSVILLPARKTARIQRWPVPAKISNQPYCEEIDLKTPPYPGPEGKFEYLGHKLVDGVEARGERTSYYSSAQAKLSGAAPVRVFENWCSVSLDAGMGHSNLDDQAKREITAVVNGIRQIEPDPALFEIPEGYKIIRVEQTAPGSNANGSSPATSARQ
jgi:hypothetical protein